jgi:hypothetical protein
LAFGGVVAHVPGALAENGDGELGGEESGAHGGESWTKLGG